MADTFTLSGNVATLSGVPFVVSTSTSQVDVFVVASEPTITDTETKVTRLGTFKAVVAADGSFAATDLPSTADAAYMPDGFLYRIAVRYRDAVTGSERRYESNWFVLTADTNFADVVNVALTAIDQATYESLIGARDQAVAAAAAASQLATSDGQTATNVTGGTLTKAALTASTALRDQYSAAPFGGTMQVWVSRFGSDANDGRGPSNSHAVRTVQHAVDILPGNGGIIYLVDSGDYVETVTVLNKPNVAIIGMSGRASDACTAIKAPSVTASCIVWINSTNGRIIDVGTKTFGSGAAADPWSGVGIDVQHSSGLYVRGWSHLSADNATDGGTAAKFLETENCLFEKYMISGARRGLHFVNEATENMFVSGQISRCSQDLVIEGNCGANIFLRLKTVAGRPSTPGAPNIAIGGGGGHYFLGLEGNEAVNADGSYGLAYCNITSDKNTLVHAVGSPQLTCTVSGSDNDLSKYRVLKSLVVTGSRNTFPKLHVAENSATVTDTGVGNRFDSPIVPSAATFTLNATSIEVVGRPRKTAGRWYSPYTGPTAGAAATTLNRVIYMPVQIDQRHKIAAIGVFIATAGAAGALGRLGVYADAGGTPGALIAATATIDFTTTGDKSGALTYTAFQSPGRYWLAFVEQVATASVLGPSANYQDGSMGADSISNITRFAGSFYQSGVTGALPATATPATNTAPDSAVIAYQLA